MAKDVQKQDPYKAALAQDTHETELDLKRMPALILLQGKSKPVTEGLSPPGRWWSGAHSAVVKGGKFALIRHERVWQVFAKKDSGQRGLVYRTHNPEDQEVQPNWMHRAIFTLVYGPFGIDGVLPCPMICSFHGKSGLPVHFKSLVDCAKSGATDASDRAAETAMALAKRRNALPAVIMLPLEGQGYCMRMAYHRLICADCVRSNSGRPPRARPMSDAQRHTPNLSF